MIEVMYVYNYNNDDRERTPNTQCVVCSLFHNVKSLLPNDSARHRI